MTVIKFIVVILLVICTSVSGTSLSLALKDQGDSSKLGAICSSLTLMLYVLMSIVIILQVGL